MLFVILWKQTLVWPSHCVSTASQTSNEVWQTSCWSVQEMRMEFLILWTPHRGPALRLRFKFRSTEDKYRWFESQTSAETQSQCLFSGLCLHCLCQWSVDITSVGLTAVWCPAPLTAQHDIHSTFSLFLFVYLPCWRCFFFLSPSLLPSFCPSLLFPCCRETSHCDSECTSTAQWVLFEMRFESEHEKERHGTSGLVCPDE